MHLDSSSEIVLNLVTLRSHPALSALVFLFLILGFVFWLFRQFRQIGWRYHNTVVFEDGEVVQFLVLPIVLCLESSDVVLEQLVLLLISLVCLTAAALLLGLDFLVELY